MDIKDFIKLNITICDAPVRGSTFITTDGRFLNLKAAGYDHDGFLAELTKTGVYPNEKDALSDILKDGWIRCNDGAVNGYCYIELYDVKPTSKQYRAIVRWVDNAIYKNSDITVIFNTAESYDEQKYLGKRIVGEDIANSIKRAYKCGALCDAQKLYDLRAYLDGPKRQPTLHEKLKLNIDPTLHVTRFFGFKEGDVIVIKDQYRPEIKFNKYGGYFKYVGPMGFIVSLIENIKACKKRPFLLFMNANGYSYYPCMALKFGVSNSYDLWKLIVTYKDLADVFVVHYLHSNVDQTNTIRLLTESDELKNKVVIMICEVTHINHSLSQNLCDEQDKDAHEFNTLCKKYGVSSVYELHDGDSGQSYSLLNAFSGEIKIYSKINNVSPSIGSYERVPAPKK